MPLELNQNDKMLNVSGDRTENTGMNDIKEVDYFPIRAHTSVLFLTKSAPAPISFSLLNKTKDPLAHCFLNVGTFPKYFCICHTSCIISVNVSVSTFQHKCSLF